MTTKEAEEFSTQKGFLFHEVSAKTGEEVQELFTSVIFPEMARKYNIGDEDEEAKKEQEGENKGKVVLNNNEGNAKKKGGCCGGGKNKKEKVEQTASEEAE